MAGDEPAAGVELAPGWELEAAVDVATLEQHPDNPRTHDLPRIRKSMRAHGYLDPVVAQVSTRRVIGGNGRLTIAQEDGIPTLPVVWVDVDDDEALAILIDLNAPTDQAGYDEHRLLDAIDHLRAAGKADRIVYTDEDRDELRRLTGALGASAGSFLDGLAAGGDPNAVSHGDAAGRDDSIPLTKHLDMVGFNLVLTPDERGRLMRVVDHARAEFDVNTAGKALLLIAEDWMNTRGEPETA